MRKLIVFLLIISNSIVLTAQKKPAYKLYNTKGKATSYRQMLKKMSKADVVLFGEHHNNPIVHWLQYEVIADLSSKIDLTLGAEMFESDNQQQLDDYLTGEINQRTFDTVARLWSNYYTDYKPLVDFAKNKQIKFIATNIPRRYATNVYRGGFEILETLPDNEKLWIAPLPIKYDATLPSYVKMKEMMGGHGNDNLPKAQAIKDATIAYFILKNRDENKLFMHFNGSYHSDYYEGIYWYLIQAESDLNIITVSLVEEENIKKLNSEEKGKADFIIVVPTTMTKTY